MIHTRGPLLEETHYYPFGLTMAGISSKASAFGTPENKLKFNDGTELNSSFDINLYETNFRSLDPQLGRFWQIDPLAEITEEVGPYCFANNNPILLNDPLGLSADSTGQNWPGSTPENAIPTGIDVVVVAHPAPKNPNDAFINLPGYRPYVVPPQTITQPTVPQMEPEPDVPKIELGGPGIFGTMGLVIAGVLLPIPIKDAPYHAPHPFAPEPFRGHGNSNENTNPHIIYEFSFTLLPNDRRTSVLKYGISDASRYGFNRPQSQLARLVAIYGASVKFKILTRTLNRAQAKFIEQSLVTKHVETWHEKPREQDLPNPFNFNK